MNTNAIQMVQAGSSTRLVVEATKEALESTPSYDESNRRYATGTGADTMTDTTGSTTPRPPASWTAPWPRMPATRPA